MRILFRRSLLAAVIGAAFTFGAVQAQTETQAPAQTRFDLLRQPLDEAIREIARLASINIVVDSRLVQGLETPGLKIRATPEDALKRVLEGTGLTPLYVDAHTVTILSKDHARAVQSAAQKQEGTDRPFGLARADTTGSDPSPLDPPIRQGIFELEELEIVVTGTRIRGANSSASPTYSFDRKDFAVAGATSVQQMMQTLPQNFTGGNTETSGALASARNGAAANIAFGAGLNLRGLGNASTLVLLNGRRMAPAGLGGFVDVSTIPLSALERIDVVPDATSAVYGSDAVGGVVNFILRSDYQGAETSVRYGSVTDGGMREFTATQLAGTTWASGSILLNVDYGSREPLLASERAYSPGLSQDGRTYLTPSEDRIGVLVNGHQTLADALTLKAVAYVNTRNADAQSFINSVGRQLTAQGDTDQAGGTIPDLGDWPRLGDHIGTDNEPH